MEYKDIPRTLKRYSFAEKMNMLQKWSRKTMNLTGVISENESGNLPYPWELETLLLFAVTAQEWQQGRFHERDRKFEEIVNCIRNHMHSAIKQLEGTPELVNEVFVAIGAVQFELQEYPYYKLYRYHWCFAFSNDRINMPSRFCEKFGCDYKDFAVFALLLWSIFSREVPEHAQKEAVYRAVCAKFQSVRTQLTITREDFKRQLESIASCIDDYMYCLRPSYTYPFIQDGDATYLPLPHLLFRAVTSSMLYRMTQGDDSLERIIGKEVLEEYLYQIIQRSGMFDEVYPEQTFRHGRDEGRSLDVLARKGDHFVFFDSKMYVPKRDLRIFKQVAYQQEIQRLAKSCKQIYEHIRHRFPSRYNPFHCEDPVKADNIYGLVVVRDNPYIGINSIYTETASLLKIPLDSPEYDWLCHHVGIVSLSRIECFCFTHSNLPNHIYGSKKREKPTDFWLTEGADSRKLRDVEFQAFRKDLVDSCRAVIKEFSETGFFS